MKNSYRNSINEDINKSRIMQGKRVLANSEGTLFDLKLHSKKLFMAFQEAKVELNKALSLIPIQYRLGSTLAQLFQCFLAEKLDKYFPNNFYKGINNRLILNINGYIILFKKLNVKGYPMNIKTETVDAIANQLLQISLFEYDGHEPIIYFGYEVNRVGEIVNPKIIYIDEDSIKFSLSEEQFSQTTLKNKKVSNQQNKSEVSPKLKKKDTDDKSDVA